ncbi:PorP/SprF family type IX secretion system membrane protein [Psychroserpens burtonensis]|uniref:PorP/SprF family type IX secretion system membrane protein n=1 Tax=Psychroserpens burtonensis TaxID=49278 RepID=UPI000687BA22|nr:PorP/SprF family type IX secretion system membrane protein [Psychroserpens burtonensis]
MKTYLFVLVLCIFSIQMFYSQEDNGVVSLSLPLRNSLTFNRYVINPTFSFVREQTKYISIFNKREWVEFENAPLTYLASYSGRFGENIGAGIGVFQQNYGVLTTFGGNLNFAYNVQLQKDSNLTFGLNIAAYKSGINTGNVITNFDDPALQNIPENLLLTVNPGINYGTGFFDFGVSINNLALYNFESSMLIEDNPQQGIQGHIMYTGYMMSSRGFFDESKFTGLLRSEFQKDDTIISAMAMLTVPKGIWAQVGYNTRFGVSGGLGINITSQIALEYNYEKAIGDLSTFGSSHDFTLAYRFKSNNRYDYSSGDEVSGLLISDDKRKPKIIKASKPKRTAVTEVSSESKSETTIEIANEDKVKADKEAQDKLLAVQKAKEQADDAQAKLLAEQKAKEQADSQAIVIAEQKAKEQADDAQAKLLAEQKAKEQADSQAIVIAEQKAKEQADAQAIVIAEQKVKEQADAQFQLLEEQKAKEDLISNAKDELGKSMYEITKQTEDSKTIQSKLLQDFDAIIERKDKDLKDLKEENDLSEKGITVGPKPFKSITAENNKLEVIKSQLDDVIKNRNEKIKELKALYDDKFEADTITNDDVYLYYQKTLKRLESEQLKTIEARTNLEIRLADIKVATEFERRRRIKKAAFDNEEERYSQDRAALQNIKQTTPLSSVSITVEDFDFGEKQSDNIQILQNVQNIDNGYYLILAVHTEVNKRNAFITKVVASGRTNVDFFYDVNTSKYYIYYDEFESIEEANQALELKGNRPYNKKLSLVKIEN